MIKTKIDNDKYYTPSNIVDKCLKITKEMINFDYITEIIEPSAGNGSFSNKINNCIAYDIEPENENIIKQDFLLLDVPYKPGRLIIGNPPFGYTNTLAVQFFKKSVKISDYIAFILSISQLNNNVQMYDFDLISSTDLGIQLYSGRKLHCCFNIYKRPGSGNLNKRPRIKLDEIIIKEYRRGGNYKKPHGFDFSLCSWGGKCGIVPNFVGEYAQELYVFVKNKELLPKVEYLLKYENVQKYAKSISITSLKISASNLYMYFLKNIEGVK